MHRRALTASLTGVTVALTGSIIGLGASGGPAQAADPGSPLVLSAPDRVVARSHDGWIYSDLGIRTTARGENFELRANRPASEDLEQRYSGPIGVVWKRETGDVSLPADSMSTWQGIDDFTTIRISRDGQRLRRLQMPGCFNGFAQRVSPDGPATNPYPWGCPWHPYTLGSVMGIAEGYTASLFPEWGGASFRLKPGTYDMVAQISPKWREFFGIATADGKVSTTLVVREGREYSRPNATRTAPDATDGDGDGLEPAASEPTRAAQGALAVDYAPDLQSLPAFDISINRRGTAIRFGANVWNGGTGPLVVDGFRSEGEDHMTAYQYFFDADGNQTGYQQVGEMHWHGDNHRHWHFEDFARYRLMTMDEEGNLERAVRSTKRSFCLANTDAVDYTVPNADWHPEDTDLSTACGGRTALSVREVLSNGSGDTYHQYRAGQAFRIGNLPDGVYYISVEANPDDRDGRNLVELAYDNNTSLRQIRIGTNRRTGERFVRATQVGIVDENMGFGFFRLR